MKLVTAIIQPAQLETVQKALVRHGVQVLAAHQCESLGELGLQPLRKLH